MTMELKPFRVEFDLCSPIQMDYLPIHLDGLIAWALLQDEIQAFLKGERENAPNPADCDSSLYASLPLKRENGVYCASVILPGQVDGQSTRYFTRGSDAESLATLGIRESEGRGTLIRNMKNMRRIFTSGGALKAGFEINQVQHVPTCVGYGIGDIESVQSLLKAHVAGLGKNRAKGHGSISDIRVEEDELAHEHWKLRAMPSQFDGGVPIITPVRPPYWNKSLRQVAYLPKELL